ncbi:DUF192 domain-containing protein [Sulfitobacter sp. HNIBRBA3233]|uniref:DUF192 domain-containing protein n=1 Tax=Sulfitobacter marinivivus TaxID=3158558 RepID=UPI0032E01BC6
MGNGNLGRRAFVLGVLSAPLVARGALAQSCPTGRVTITGSFGKAAFNVDIADTESTRAQGLMHVESMPLSQGMLFVYDRPQQMSFWMRNTLIPLDMLFLDDAGVIRHIHHRAQPLDESVISPGPMLLRGVLEINGGLARRLGIEEGDVLRHPAFVSEQEPWSCDTAD